MDNLNVIKDGQLFSFRVKVNNTGINCVTIYEPHEGDNSDFLLTTKKVRYILTKDKGNLSQGCERPLFDPGVYEKG